RPTESSAERAGRARHRTAPRRSARRLRADCRRRGSARTRGRIQRSGRESACAAAAVRIDCGAAPGASAPGGAAGGGRACEQRDGRGFLSRGAAEAPQQRAESMTEHPHSRDLYERACRVIPGGVNSPVRAFRAGGGTPLFIQRGAGQKIVDADGRTYVDLVGSWGALILGHAHPAVVAAINEASRLGTTFGAPCAAEVELAERVVGSYPGIEQVRFVSSGTEAVMSAIRLARAFTARDLIVKFSGCYHGHADHLLVAAGSGLATFGRPSSAGVPEAFTACTRVLPLDDESAVEALFTQEGA